MCEDKVRKFVLFQILQMIIFVSVIGLKILSECNRWHGDGTFSVDMMEYLYRVSNLIHDYSAKKTSTPSTTATSSTASALTSQDSNQLSEESE